MTRSPKRRTGRGDSGETLVSVIVAMVVTGLVMPAVLHMIYVTAQMAAAQPVHDSAIAATSQLQSTFAEIDPVRVCLSPAGTGRRDQCLTTSKAVGASLVDPPPDALEIDPMTICWLARPDNPDTAPPQIESGLKTQCLMLRDDGNDTPFAPNARRATSEIDRQISPVDPRGGDELIVRTYDIAAPSGGGGDPADYLLPVAGAQSWADQVVYFDAEWWCLRWRHPKDDSDDGVIVGRWIGNCPCPSDTFEQIPLPATVKTLTDPDTNSPTWADTDGTLTPGSSPDDGDPYDDVAQLALATGTCDRVAEKRSDGTVNPDHCADSAQPLLPGVPILSRPPADSGNSGNCATDAWWNPRYSGEKENLRGYLLPPEAVSAGGDRPPKVRSRVASMEIRVCVATTADTRNRGGAHCELDVLRFSLLGFDGLSTSSTPSPVTVTVTDIDTATLIVTGPVTMEENSTDTFTVKLAAAPTGSVTVTISSADTATATVSPPTLIFTTTDYDTAQTVTVTGVHDTNAVTDTTTVTISADTAAPVSVAVTVTDTAAPVSAAALIVTGPVTLDENSTDTFTVNLAAAPTGSVTVTVTSADTATATVSPPTLDFTTTDYGTAQTVTVTGIHDIDAVDDTTSVALSAADGGYDALTASVAVTVTDIDPVATNPPGTPTNAVISCTAAGATITWDAPGGQPTIYEVEVTFSPGGEKHTQFISHPSTTADFDLGNGYYSAGVRAYNSYDGSLNWGNTGTSC